MSTPATARPPDVPVHAAQWAELVTTALLGTDRRVEDGLDGPDGPTVLLRRAARHRVLDLLAEPATDAALPIGEPADPAPTTDRPSAPPAADRLLDDLLATPDPALVSCWLRACAAHGRTVSPVHWTRLARLAGRTTAYDRRALGDALGARGRWFLRQNPEWRKLAADVAGPADPTYEAPAAVALTAADVLADPDSLFAAVRPWSAELVSAGYAVLGGEGAVPPTRGYATRLGIALPTALYASIARAGEYYVLAPDASPARRRTIRDRFVALELAAYVRAAIDHAFSQHATGFTRAEIPHV